MPLREGWHAVFPDLLVGGLDDEAAYVCGSQSRDAFEDVSPAVRRLASLVVNEGCEIKGSTRKSRGKRESLAVTGVRDSGQGDRVHLERAVNPRRVGSDRDGAVAGCGCRLALAKFDSVTAEVNLRRERRSDHRNECCNSQTGQERHE